MSRCAAAGAREGEVCVQEGEEGGGRGEGGWTWMEVAAAFGLRKLVR